MNPVRVYIVDDNIDFVNAVKRFLSMESCITIVGYSLSAEKALEQIKIYKPDLILMDFVMPDMDGAELTYLVKKEPDAPRVIVVSLHDEIAYWQAAKDAGADGFISKTDFTDSIIEYIGNFFGISMSRKQSLSKTL